MRAPGQPLRYEPLLRGLIGLRLVRLRRALRPPADDPAGDGVTELGLAGPDGAPLVLAILYDDDEECLVPRREPIAAGDLPRAWRVVDLARDTGWGGLCGRALAGISVLALRERDVDFDVAFGFRFGERELWTGIAAGSTDVVVAERPRSWLGGAAVREILSLGE
jgi:hypothetical protein